MPDTPDTPSLPDTPTFPIRPASWENAGYRHAMQHVVGRLPARHAVYRLVMPDAGGQDGGRVGRAAHMPGHRRMSCDSTRALPLRHRHAYSRHRPTVLSSSLDQRAPAVRHAPVLMHLFVIGRTAPSVKSFSTDSRVDVGLHSIRLAEVTRGREGLPVRRGVAGSVRACPAFPCAGAGVSLPLFSSPPAFTAYPFGAGCVMRASLWCKGRPEAREWGDRANAATGQVRRSAKYEGQSGTRGGGREGRSRSHQSR